MTGATPRAPGLPVVWSSRYEVDIGAHVFPTVKYRLVRDRLLDEGIVAPDDLVEPAPATRDEVALVHTREYLAKVFSGTFTPIDAMRLELPFSDHLREASLLCCGGTILAGELALERGAAAHIGGGFHHAFAGHGEGFCLLNDVAVAPRVLQARGAVERVAVVDLDVHHGNGTAAIFADDPSVFTFSMHQEWNYPAEKPPGDLDVGLEDGTGNEAYLELLREHMAGILSSHRPDLVLYLAGADPYREDQLGGLALTLEGLRERDRTVFSMSRDAGAAVAVVLAGGYARDTDDTVEIHVNTVRAAREAMESSR
jgi:acetoin utilization deacetylase AcuC-like enzyme